MAREIQIPISEEEIRSLRVGDQVELTGILYTGRDAVHKYLAKGGELPPGVNLQNGVLYHCGPVVIQDENGQWKVVAAGPTTSIREEPYEADLIAKYGLRGVIGKGGMGPKTLEACQKYGCVYFHAVGGAAQVLAERIRRVRNVYMLEQFGPPEAIWELEVERFPVVVTMDSHGHSLHKTIQEASEAKLRELLGLP